MIKVNDNYGFFNHKNIELLRYYISRNLKQIEDQLKRRNDKIISYIIASLVDLFVVLFFYDELRGISTPLKLFFIVLLIGLLLLLSMTVKQFLLYYSNYQNTLGKKALINNDEVQRVVDEFDNIACDGLLVCLYYIDKADAETDNNKKLFYLYEVIHHFRKSTNVFREVYNSCCSYVSQDDDQLLDSFRVKNYIDFSKMINYYLQNCKMIFPQNEDLSNVLTNINELVNEWDHFEKGTT